MPSENEPVRYASQPQSTERPFVDLRWPSSARRGVVSTESEQLDAYLQEADQLRGRRLVRDGTLSDAFSMGASKDAGMSITLPTMDEEDLRSFLLGLRKFISSDDPLFVNKIHNILWQHIQADRARELLADRRKIWNQASKSGKVALVVNEQKIAPADLLDWWVNGVYFHNDERKRKRLEDLGFARETFGRQVFNAQLVAATNQISFLANFIRFARSQGLLQI